MSGFTVITAAEFERQMKEIRSSVNDKQDLKDFEKAHYEADELMCKALLSLGYDAGVKTFQEMPKFYA